MAVPSVPILDREISWLSKPVDIIKYVLRHYLATPKNINDTFADEEISFIYDNAMYGSEPNTMASKVRDNLQGVLNRYFERATRTDVDVEYTHIDDNRYNMTIDILVVIDGKPYSISSNYQVNDGKLVYDFQG